VEGRNAVSLALFFDAARTLKRELAGGSGALTQEEVDALNAVIAPWKPGGAEQSDRARRCRRRSSPGCEASFGALDQSQVDGFEALLQAFGMARWPVAFASYGLATAWRETNETMQPVREAYWLSEDWRKSEPQILSLVRARLCAS
jgi:hypothetical protein